DRGTLPLRQIPCSSPSRFPGDSRVPHRGGPGRLTHCRRRGVSHWDLPPSHSRRPRRHATAGTRHLVSPPGAPCPAWSSRSAVLPFACRGAPAGHIPPPHARRACSTWNRLFVCVRADRCWNAVPLASTTVLFHVE